MLLIAADGYYPDSPQESSVAARSYPCLPGATSSALLVRNVGEVRSTGVRLLNLAWLNTPSQGNTAPALRISALRR